MHRTSILLSIRPSPMWDIFCNVIDNYGDIGVCWRLARQLSREQNFHVRLWIDDLDAFQALCPQIDTSLPIQSVDAVQIRRWAEPFPEVRPGEVVIEAFGCRLPESFLNAMAQQGTAPRWINLEYLSAENWVNDCHALPSPHPRLPLTKYFFFPGFTAETGGLLRESDLITRREQFLGSMESRNQFWNDLAIPPPSPDTLCVSLFSYENTQLPSLLKIWSEGSKPVRCLIPESRALSSLAHFYGRTLRVGDHLQYGQLEIVALPFVEQSRYDLLLWACDLNFVRGEDSFVRAQWAAKPLIWHIYPQEEEAHLGKLDAFLQRYCQGMPPPLRAATESFWHGWNGGTLDDRLWNNLSAGLDEWRVHARNWSNHLEQQKDLSSALVRFCRSKV